MRSYPPYDELMKEDSDVTVDVVSQSQYRGKEGFGTGICGGLAFQNIFKQLHSHSKTQNPFNDDNIFPVSAAIHNYCHGEVNCFEQVLKEDSALSTKPIKAIDNTSLESELIKTIHHTINDKKARGIFIGVHYHRNPYNSEPLDNKHALSMTVKYHDGKLTGTAMDPNFFFSKGKGVSGCEKIAHKLAMTSEAYDASSPILIIKTKKREEQTSPPPSSSPPKTFSR